MEATANPKYQIDVNKNCIRLYSWNKTYGRTQHEVFLQADENGIIRYYKSNMIKVENGRNHSYVQEQIEISSKDAKRYLSWAENQLSY